LGNTSAPRGRWWQNKAALRFLWSPALFLEVENFAFVLEGDIYPSYENKTKEKSWQHRGMGQKREKG
jgi:hypothetical protein